MRTQIKNEMPKNRDVQKGIFLMISGFADQDVLRKCCVIRWDVAEILTPG